MKKKQHDGKTGLPKLDLLYHAPFEFKVASALGISVAADILDYVGAPIFALPVIGDIADLFVSGKLYSITKSKKAAAINAIEFIPVVGDLIPAYTISTFMWLYQELSKRKNEQERVNKAIVIRADPKVTFGKKHVGAVTARLGNNEKIGNYNNFPDSSGSRSHRLKEEERMKRLLISRYNRWKSSNNSYSISHIG